MDSSADNRNDGLTPPPVNPFLGEVDENGEYIYGSGSPSKGKQSALMQGSNIPQGWKPSATQPIPVTRCTAPIKNGDRKGERCGRWAITGATVCIVHGGRLPSVRKAAEDRVHAAKMRLLDSSDEAIDTLIDLLTSAGDQVKLGAAKEILDRAGIKGGMDVEVNVTTNVKPSEIIQEKLRTIAERTAAANEKPAYLTDDQDDSSDNPDIVKGETVEE